MFPGDDQNQNSNSATTPTEPAADIPASDTPTGVVVPDDSAAPAAPTVEADAVASAPSAPTIPDPMVTPAAQPEAGINGVAMQNGYIEPASQIGPAKPAQPDTVPTAASMITAAPDVAAVDPDLSQIKQQALQSLEPLVGQLDQAPEEKFKTIMMLIQASDNSKMLKEAYTAASQITDEKTRAQALLDIVNEINYFTQQAKGGQ